MKQANNYSYSIDDFGTMTVWADDITVAEVSDCKGMTDAECQTLMGDVLTELEWKIKEN